MKKIMTALLLTVISVIHINAAERFSFQAKPLFLYPFSVFQTIFILSEGYSLKDIGGLPVTVDVEVQYAINNNITFLVNPVFRQGFWKYAPIGSMHGIEYYSSNCLNLAAGILYRPNGTGLRGLYAGASPVIGWGYITHGRWGEDGKKIADFLNLGFITEAGYEWIFNNGFTITLGAGISKLYQIPKVSIITAHNAYGDDMYVYGNPHGLLLFSMLNLPVDPVLRFSMGYSF